MTGVSGHYEHGDKEKAARLRKIEGDEARAEADARDRPPKHGGRTAC